MLSIRRGIFETNSSSNDRYDDFDDYPESEVSTNITFTITLEFADFVTRERKETIRDLINDSSRFEDVDLFEDVDDDIEDMEDGLYARLDDNENLVIEVTYSCIVHGTDWVDYCPATRYEPAEGGYYEDWEFEVFKYDKNTHQYKLDEKTTKCILDTLNGILEDIFNDYADEEDEYAEYVNELIKIIKFDISDFEVKD